MLQKLSLFFFFFLPLFLSLPLWGLCADGSNSLRLALLPIPDVLPVYVAQEKGYFDDLGLCVETLPVGSAVERDQLMQAGRIDGMINDILSAANFNREQNRVKIVSIARSPLAASPLIRILATPGSDLKKAGELAGTPIGISRNTVIEYISTRLLEAGGVTAEAISYTSVPILPQRLQLLLSGQLKAAALPDPLGASAVRAGAVEIINDTALSKVSASVITFSNETLLQKQDAVRSFMAAWDRATADLNDDPASFHDLMMKKIRVPKNIQSDFPPPPIPRKALPSRAQWDDVMEWMLKKNILSAPLPYEDSVTSAFLAK